MGWTLILSSQMKNKMKPLSAAIFIVKQHEKIDEQLFVIKCLEPNWFDDRPVDWQSVLHLDLKFNAKDTNKKKLYNDSG